MRLYFHILNDLMAFFEELIIKFKTFKLNKNDRSPCVQTMSKFASEYDTD